MSGRRWQSDMYLLHASLDITSSCCHMHLNIIHQERQQKTNKETRTGTKDISMHNVTSFISKKSRTTDSSTVLLRNPSAIMVTTHNNHVEIENCKAEFFLSQSTSN
jgi:hypothetical protein